MRQDIVFYTHSSKTVGFGHAARCAKIHNALKEIDKKLSIGFMGKFDGASRELLRRLCDPQFVECSSAVVGVYDRMDDSEHPHIWSSEKLNHLMTISKHVIFMANGITNPGLPSDVTCIGYKPGRMETLNAPNFHWGLQYAPLDCDTLHSDAERYRDKDQIFIALGGGATPLITKKIIDACKRYKHSIKIKLLLSPVNSMEEADEELNNIENVDILKNLPELSFYFRSSGIVIASYGHLGYEAMSYGTPVCLVGQKKFQFEYAEKLAKEGLCVSAGLLTKMSEKQLAKSIENTFEISDSLATKTKRTFDGGGIQRIASLIHKKFLSMA